MPAFLNNKYVAVLYLDYSKAFDTIKYDVLISKLEKLGIRGLPLQLIQSYVSDRQQYVSVNNCHSGYRSISLGVPQGSANGPLFFSIYVNDLPCFINSLCNNILYADDTTIIFEGEDINVIENSLNLCLQKICEWSCYNKLSLNVNKSKAMIFSNRPYIPPLFKLYNQPVEIIDAYKYLGVSFDPKLNFNSHINDLCKKTAKFCGISLRLRNKLNMHTAKIFYHSYFQATVTYCITVWGGLLICSASTCQASKSNNKKSFLSFLSFSSS